MVIQTNNGWEEWKNFVLSEIKDNKVEIKEFRKEFSEFRLNEMQEIKSAIVESKTKEKIRNGIWAAVVALAVSVASHYIVLNSMASEKPEKIRTEQITEEPNNARP